MMQTGVQRQLSAQFWRPAPEKDPKPELNAQTGTKTGVQLHKWPLHVQHLSSAQTHTKWAPEVDLCINYLIM